jgi:hypothetical protein
MPKRTEAQGQPHDHDSHPANDAKPKRRLFGLLRSQGLRRQQVIFVTDGAVDVRDSSRYLNPQTEQFLDGFHTAVRSTAMGQMPTAG